MVRCYALRKRLRFAADIKNKCSLSLFSGLLFLLLLRSQLLSLLLKSGLCLGAGPEIETGVSVSNKLDFTLSGQFSDETASHGSVHLELFGNDSTGDAEDLGSLSEDLVVLLLLEEDFVVKLVSDLDLSPLLCCFLGTSGLVRLSTL